MSFECFFFRCCCCCCHSLLQHFWFMADTEIFQSARQFSKCKRSPINEISGQNTKEKHFTVKDVHKCCSELVESYACAIKNSLIVNMDASKYGQASVTILKWNANANAINEFIYLWPYKKRRHAIEMRNKDVSSQWISSCGLMNLYWMLLIIKSIMWNIKHCPFEHCDSKMNLWSHTVYTVHWTGFHWNIETFLINFVNFNAESKYVPIVNTHAHRQFIWFLCVFSLWCMACKYLFVYIDGVLFLLLRSIEGISNTFPLRPTADNNNEYIKLYGRRRNIWHSGMSNFRRF